MEYIYEPFLTKYVVVEENGHIKFMIFKLWTLYFNINNYSI